MMGQMKQTGYLCGEEALCAQEVISPSTLSLRRREEEEDEGLQGVLQPREEV